MPRLTIFLGGGGVGKTTLSAGYGLALARAGRRTALLGIDPARRLRSALGVADLPELGVAVADGLRAALLRPEDSLRRWAAESCADEASRARLLRNPYFLALADRMAAATDAIAAARVAEWAEREPELDEMVVDTAPGPAALELFSRPDRLLAMFDGKLIRWVRHLGRSPLASGAGELAAPRRHRVLDGLTRISGGEALRDLGELFSLLDAALDRLAGRLARARAWLRDRSTSLVLVCAVSRDGAEVALRLAAALRELRLSPRLAVINRALPAPLLSASLPGPLGAYVATAARLQRALRDRLDGEFSRVLELPDVDLAGARLDALAQLAQPLVGYFANERM